MGATAGGLAAILAVHFANSQWWSHDLLFGVTVIDPRLDSAIVGVLGVVGIAGCGLPTWRALMVDPAFALREE
jgi:hypothetical protein